MITSKDLRVFILRLALLFHVGLLDFRKNELGDCVESCAMQRDTTRVMRDILHLVGMSLVLYRVEHQNVPHD